MKHTGLTRAMLVEPERALRHIHTWLREQGLESQEGRFRDEREEFVVQVRRATRKERRCTLLIPLETIEDGTLVPLKLSVELAENLVTKPKPRLVGPYRWRAS